MAAELKPSDDAQDAARYRWLRDNVKRVQWRNTHRLRDGDLYVLRQTARDEADILHGATLDAAIDAARAASAIPAPSHQTAHGVPSGVWEALQRLIENAAALGSASQQDALLVAQWRAQFAPSPEALTAPARAVMQQALDALEMAHAGLEWYRDEQPENVNGSDEESDEVMDNAMQALRDALAAPLGCHQTEGGGDGD